MKIEDIEVKTDFSKIEELSEGIAEHSARKGAQPFITNDLLEEILSNQNKSYKRNRNRFWISIVVSGLILLFGTLNFFIK